MGKKSRSDTYRRDVYIARVDVDVLEEVVVHEAVVALLVGGRKADV
jgi:hypothetical protein